MSGNVRSMEYLKDKCATIRREFGKRVSWAQALAGYGGHIQMDIGDFSFADLQLVSKICDDTKEINVVHNSCNCNEFTPSGNNMLVYVWGPK